MINDLHQTKMSSTYVINVEIQGIDTLALVDMEEPFSVVTSGFLRNLNIGYNNVELNKKLIVLSGKILESVGMFKEIFILGNAPVEYSVQIIHADLPSLLFGRDWFDDHYARYGKSMKHIYITSQQRRLRIPLIDEEELELNENIEITETCSEATIEEQLIDLSEKSAISITPLETAHVSSDIFEIDGGMFQKDFSQSHVKLNEIEQEIIVQNDDLWKDDIIDEILMCYIEEEIDEKKSFMVDSFEQLPSNLLNEIFEWLTIADLRNMAQVNRFFNNHVALMKSDKNLKLSQEIYYHDIGQEASYYLGQTYHLINELIGKDAIRKPEKVSDIFYLDDHAKFSQNIQGDQTLDTFRPQLRNIVQKSTMDGQKTESSVTITKRSHMWNQRGHVIKKFILGPKFRMHDKNFRNSNIHMCRSLIKEKLVH